ncbi:MAG: agmatine deiminase family protein [Nitrospirae bacterium]|nr:agmatine deiminase family protein [Nitrospirota bacterium]
MRQLGRLVSAEFMGGTAYLVRPPRRAGLEDTFREIADLLKPDVVLLDEENCWLTDFWIRDWAPILLQAKGARFLWCPKYEPSYAEPSAAAFTDAMSATRGIEAIARRLKLPLRRVPLTSEGGNFVYNGRDVLIVTKQFMLCNTGLDASGWVAWFKAAFGVRLVAIEYEKRDPIRHADGYCRFLDKDVLMVASYDEDKEMKDFHNELFDCLVGKLGPSGIAVLRLPCFVTDSLTSAAGNYVNFYRNGRKVLVPAYGVGMDRTAVATLKRVRPDLEYHQIDCRRLAAYGGVLNCITATYPKQVASAAEVSRRR